MKKDLDFLKMGVRMGFSKQDRVNLLEIVQKDTRWLDRRGLIDYSLLVGIEKLEGSSELKSEQICADTSKSINVLVESSDESERGMGLMTDFLTVPNSVQLRKETLRHMDISRNQFTSSCGNYVYHISIIDYLQKWNSTKFLEYSTKVYLRGQP